MEKGDSFGGGFLRVLDFLVYLDFLVFLDFLDYLVFQVYLDFMENLVYPGISCISCPPVPQKAGFHFALLSPCTIFALTFHTYIYLRLW